MDAWYPEKVRNAQSGLDKKYNNPWIGRSWNVPMIHWRLWATIKRKATAEDDRSVNVQTSHVQRPFTKQTIVDSVERV